MPERGAVWRDLHRGTGPTVTPTLQRLVRERHPDCVPTPLDARTPDDVALTTPTVIVEVDGAREALDALERVRRRLESSHDEVPGTARGSLSVRSLAAVRLVPNGLPPGGGSAPAPVPPGRSIAVAPLASLVAWTSFALAVAVGVLAARRLADDVPGRSRLATTVLVIAVPVLAVMGVRSWRRARRVPVERRRYRERRRSRAVIAVVADDERGAAMLAAEIRRALLDVGPAGSPCHISVHVPSGGGDGPPDRDSSPPAPSGA